MSFFRYVFSFLYIRNWHTGERELSPARLYIFLGFVVLLLVATIMIAILNSPIEYRQA